VMVGGDPAVFERFRPVFESYGEPVRHVGETGSGQLCKLLNNLLFSANVCVARDTLELGGRFGLDPGALRDLLLAGSAGSFALGVCQLLDDPAVSRAFANLVKDHALYRQLADPTDAGTRAVERAAAETVARVQAAAGRSG
jgi:3-hydroxyisobutyrate dehydrogenase